MIYLHIEPHTTKSTHKITLRKIITIFSYLKLVSAETSSCSYFLTALSSEEPGVHAYAGTRERVAK